ncbi:hypothetical protein CFC21_075028, partial [Triticum aestivum]
MPSWRSLLGLGRGCTPAPGTRRSWRSAAGGGRRRTCGSPFLSVMSRCAPRGRSLWRRSDKHSTASSTY